MSNTVLQISPSVPANFNLVGPATTIDTPTLRWNGGVLEQECKVWQNGYMIGLEWVVVPSVGIERNDTPSGNVMPNLYNPYDPAIVDEPYVDPPVVEEIEKSELAADTYKFHMDFAAGTEDTPTPFVSPDDNWIDEDGTVWGRPTAWTYAMSCKVRENQRQRANAAEERAKDAETRAVQAEDEVARLTALLATKEQSVLEIDAKLVEAQQVKENCEQRTTRLKGYIDAMSQLAGRAIANE